MPMPKKKTLKKPIKKTIQVAQPTQAELKRAYQLVTQDLFSKLVKAKDKDKVTIGAMGSLGAFHKAERKVKSGIQPKGFKGKPKLNTYVYYAVRFKPSRKLKEELNQALVKKYNK
jgi:nucleoid DNA-binding protein